MLLSAGSPHVLCTAWHFSELGEVCSLSYKTAFYFLWFQNLPQHVETCNLLTVLLKAKPQIPGRALKQHKHTQSRGLCEMGRRCRLHDSGGDSEWKRPQCLSSSECQAYFPFQDACTHTNTEMHTHTHFTFFSLHLTLSWKRFFITLTGCETCLPQDTGTESVLFNAWT